MTATGAGPALAGVILAAGEGRRMRSTLPKVLHPLAGTPMVIHVVRAARAAGVARPIVVVGHDRERVAAALAEENVAIAVQSDQLGTGHAVLQAEPLLSGGGPDGGADTEVLILCGDAPLIRPRSLTAMLTEHRREGRAATVMTAVLAEPGSLGRVVRDARGDFERIVEVRDASPAEREIREINSGIYCFRLGALRSALGRLGRDNAQGQYYLTDTMSILRADGLAAGAWRVSDPHEVLGVNTPEELAEAERAWRAREGGSAGAA